MTQENKQEIAKIIIKVLKSRFDTFPEDTTQSRNAPFHKAFLSPGSTSFPGDKYFILPFPKEKVFPAKHHSSNSGKSLPLPCHGAW